MTGLVYSQSHGPALDIECQLKGAQATTTQHFVGVFFFFLYQFYLTNYSYLYDLGYLNIYLYDNF